MDGGQQEENKDNKEKRRGSSNKVLFGVFCGLLVVIVGLVIGVVVLAIKGDSDDGDSDFAPDEPFAGVDCDRLDEMYESDDVSYCIGLLYDEGKIEEVLRVYDEKIDYAISKENYYSAAELIINRSTLFVINDRCEDGLELFDDGKLEKLPKEERVYADSYIEGVKDLCRDGGYDI